MPFCHPCYVTGWPPSPSVLPNRRAGRGGYTRGSTPLCCELCSTPTANVQWDNVTVQQRHRSQKLVGARNSKASSANLPRLATPNHSKFYQITKSLHSLFFRRPRAARREGVPVPSRSGLKHDQATHVSSRRLVARRWTSGWDIDMWSCSTWPRCFQIRSCQLRDCSILAKRLV